MCEKCKKLKEEVNVKSKSIYCTDDEFVCSQFVKLMEKFYEYQKLESEVIGREIEPWTYDNILGYVFTNAIRSIEDDIEILNRIKN